MPRMTRPPHAIALLLLAASATAEAPATPAPAKAPPGGAKARYAVLETSRGKIGVRLLPAKAPKAVENFVGLATGKKAWTDPATGKKSNAPLYDGTLFHRVISGFMIQGGDPLSRGASIGQTSTASGRPFGTGDPGFRFADELEPVGAQPFATPCQLAMANSGPNSNGAQFFVTEVRTDHLNPRACPGLSPTGVCGYVHLGEGVCGCNLVADIARAGNGQTKLVKVTITDREPTCQ
jgi:peptidylprolyl isomerase/peptidyl-prolyl cis-trans isomerase A (cyclophilin A)